MPEVHWTYSTFDKDQTILECKKYCWASNFKNGYFITIQSALSRRTSTRSSKYAIKHVPGTRPSILHVFGVMYLTKDTPDLPQGLSCTLTSTLTHKVPPRTVPSLRKKVHTRALWAETPQKTPMSASKPFLRVKSTPIAVLPYTTYWNWQLNM